MNPYQKTLAIVVACGASSPVLIAQPAPPPDTLFTAPYGPGGTWNLYQSKWPNTWTQAQAAAEATVDPLGNTNKKGHLVAIGSAAENMFVYHNVQGSFIWIGLTDNEKWGGKEAGANRKGEWKWVTGEPYTFSAWRSPEPDEVAGGEDGVVIEYSGRWSDWPIGSQGQQSARHPYLIEWETNSPTPVPGAIQIKAVLPEKWSVDLAAWNGKSVGKGPWSCFSVLGFNSRSIETSVEGLAKSLSLVSSVARMSELNYQIIDEHFIGGGWTSVTGKPNFPMIDGPCAALHVAKVQLEQGGTWSFNVHGDDYFAVRFPGLKWKSATGLGGIDPLDPATIYHGCESGDGCVIGTIDLPAGDSTIEVVLANRGYNGMIQLLAASGEITLDGGTDKWRYPGHKAAGELAWPGTDSAGWTVTRTNRSANGAPLLKLMDGLALAEMAEGIKVAEVKSINYAGSDSAGDIEFPDPVDFPGDLPGVQNQFVVKATCNLVIPRDGIYHIGIHADDHCALRVLGQKWIRLVRDTSYVGKSEGDTIYGEGPTGAGTNVQLFGEIQLKKGTYQMEALYTNVKGPSVFSVFAAPEGFAPRLLAKDGARIEPDIDGLPLVE